MNIYLEIVLRSVVAVVFLLIVARLDGARQISQLTFYDYIVGITIGSIAGTLCVDTDIPVWFSLIAIGIFFIFSYIISWLTNKSILCRRVFTGFSKILISNGQLNEKVLKSSRFDINDVLRELRVQGYFNINEVQYAILETNGKISIMPKEGKRNVTTEDMGKIGTQNSLVTNVIIDGKVMIKNLENMQKDQNWLDEQLKSQKVENIKDVLLGTLDGDGNLSVYFCNQTSQEDAIFL